MRRPDCLIVGLTGGVATGKSTVAARFAAHGAIVIDADRIAREVVEPGQPALQDIVRRFGPDVIDGQGRLKRGELARIVFHDADARRDLEAIVHPRVRERMNQAVAAAPPASIIVLDVPLLFETGDWRQRVDVTVVVYADRSAQRARLRSRDGLSDEDIERRLAAQWPTARKLACADFVVYNQADRDALYRQVDDLWARLDELRRRKVGGLPSTP